MSTHTHTHTQTNIANSVMTQELRVDLHKILKSIIATAKALKHLLVEESSRQQQAAEVMVTSLSPVLHSKADRELITFVLDQSNRLHVEFTAKVSRGFDLYFGNMCMTIKLSVLRQVRCLFVYTFSY